MIGVLKRSGDRMLPTTIGVVAGIVGLGIAVALMALQTKAFVALFGLLAIAIVAMVSGHPRQVLLGLVIMLLPLNVETNLDYNAHLGGAPGLVITLQMVLLVPLFVLAIIERAVRARERLWPRRIDVKAGLGLPAILVPLIPLVASVPSLFVTDFMAYGKYELARLLAFYLIYLYIAITFRPPDLKLIVGALMLGILIELPFAALEYVKPDFHPQIFGQASGSTQEAVGATGAAVSRVSGTLTHPNELGSWLILLLPLALLSGLSKSSGFRLRLIAWVAFVAGTGMLVFTYSRGSWVGAAVALPLALILAAAFRQVPVAQVTALMAAGLLAVTVVVLSPPVLARLTESDPLNVTFRFEIAQVAINIWQSQPIVGVGLNSFVENAQRFDVLHIALLSSGQYDKVPPPNTLQSLPVHNVYLLWLAEVGVIGFVGWVTYLSWVVIRCFRAMRSRLPLAPIFVIGFLAGATALYVGDLASFTSRIDPVMQTFMIMAGATVALIPGRWSSAEAS